MSKIKIKLTNKHRDPQVWDDVACVFDVEDAVANKLYGVVEAWFPDDDYENNTKFSSWLFFSNYTPRNCGIRLVIDGSINNCTFNDDYTASWLTTPSGTDVLKYAHTKSKCDNDPNCSVECLLIELEPIIQTLFDHLREV